MADKLFDIMIKFRSDDVDDIYNKLVKLKKHDLIKVLDSVMCGRDSQRVISHCRFRYKQYWRATPLSGCINVLEKGTYIPLEESKQLLIDWLEFQGVDFDLYAGCGKSI